MTQIAYSKLPRLSSVEMVGLNGVMDEVQKNTGAPPELVMTVIFSVLSISIQGLVDVKKPTGQVTPVSLLTLVVALSGERKTTVEKICCAVIIAFERTAQADFAVKMAEFKVEHAIWKIKCKFLTRKIMRQSKEGESGSDDELELRTLLSNEPLKPKLPQIFYNDASSVALFEYMPKRWNCAALLSSEGSGILSGGLFQDMARLNAAWSGDDIPFDRVRGSFTWSGRLSASIQVQPGPFQSFLDRRRKDARETGLLSRFLITYPASTQGYRLSDTTIPLGGFYASYNQRVLELIEETAIVLNTGTSRVILEFSPQAKQRWLSTFDKVESMILPGGGFHGFSDIASRAMDHVSRLAALMHYYSGGADSQISDSVLADAIEVSSYYSGEAQRLLTVPPIEQQNAIALSSKLNDYRQSGRRYMLKNSLRQLAPHAIRKGPAFDMALDQLVNWGQVSIINYQNYWIVDLAPGYPDYVALNWIVNERKSRALR